MKVALELQPCLKNRSGIGIYTYELSKRLQDCNDIELTGDIFNFLNRNDLVKDLEGLSLQKEICKLFPYGVYRRIWHHIPLAYDQLFKREADITHFFNFIVPPRIKGKVINTVHDLTFELYPETMDERNLKRIKQDIGYSIERSERIVTISESTKKDMVEILKIDPSRIEIIYPGVNYELFNLSYKGNIKEDIKESIKKKYQLPDDYLLYMGTLEPRKNIPIIIEAFARLKRESDSKVKEVKLVLAGKKGWLFEDIFNKVQQLGLEADVIFTDYVAEEDKAIIYSEAKAFVFPSLYEGFGMPVVEAMAAGVPVITSNVSSLPEVAGDAAILVNPQDSVTISEALYRLLADQEYHNQLVIKGLEQAKKFNWNRSAQQLKEIYYQVLES